LLQQMSFLMRCQVRTLREPFTAIRIATHIRLFSCMRSQMSPEVEIKGEAFLADLALVRAFAGMY